MMTILCGNEKTTAPTLETTPQKKYFSMLIKVIFKNNAAKIMSIFFLLHFFVVFL